MKVAIYCRVSTEEQAIGGHSIEAQKQELKKYCDAFDYDIFDQYIDAGYSASTMERPALQRLLQDADKYDIALVWRLDRISRDMSDLMKILEVFNNKNVIFKSKTESFDTSTASGKLMLNMLGSFAEFERESISERIKLAHLKILKDGKWRGGRPPLGYKLTEDKTLSIDKDEAEIIETIFHLSAHNNIGGRSIASKLNNLGYSTRSNKPFTSSYITRILKNPTYYGEMVHGRQERIKRNGKKTIQYNDEFDTYLGEFQPIISKELFKLSESNMNQRKNNRGDSAAIPNILSGLIYCGDCHEPMIRSKRKDGKAFFMCKGYKDYCKCNHHYISESIVIKNIKKTTEGIIINKNVITQFNKELSFKKENRLQEIGREIEHLKEEIEGYTNREDKLLELIEKSIITDREFVRRKKILSEEKNDKVTKLKVKTNDFKNLSTETKNDSFKLKLESFNQEFENLSYQSKKKLLNELIERIEVFDNNEPYARKKVHIYLKI